MIYPGNFCPQIFADTENPRRAQIFILSGGDSADNTLLNIPDDHKKLHLRESAGRSNLWKIRGHKFPQIFPDRKNPRRAQIFILSGGDSADNTLLNIPDDHKKLHLRESAGHFNLRKIRGHKFPQILADRENPRRAQIFILSGGDLAADTLLNIPDDHKKLHLRESAGRSNLRKICGQNLPQIFADPENPQRAQIFILSGGDSTDNTLLNIPDD